MQLQMIFDDCLFPLHERHNDKSLCHFDTTKAMSTLHRLASRVDMKNIPVWYKQKRPRNGTSRLHRSIDRTRSLADEGLVLNSNHKTLVFYFRAFSTWRLRRQIFCLTYDELDLLLRCVLVFKSKCEYEGLSWEGTKAKYDKIKELVVERYPNKLSDNPNEKFPCIGKTELITKERISAKPEKMRKDYKNFVDSGRTARYRKENV